MVKFQDVEEYPLHWIDFLITVTLNPNKTDIQKITEYQYNTITNRIEIEKSNLQVLINNGVFSLNREDEITLLIRKYYSSLIILLDQLIENKKTLPNIDYVDRIHRKLVTTFDELLSFIETRFSKYITLDDRAPITYVAITKQELKEKIRNLKYLSGKNLVARMILERMNHFIKSKSYSYELTFRVVLYKKQLLKGLQEINWRQDNCDLFSPLEQLLIYMNFNSKKFMNLLTSRISKEINSLDNSMDRMDRLLQYYKAFKQLHRKPDTKLNPKYHNIDQVIGNWFAQEIIYIEKKLRLAVLPLQGCKVVDEQTEKKYQKYIKLLCILSTDQMALILRAADDLRIVHAKSLTEVFRTIAPHLSTPYKEDISHEAMRSKAYNPEERDKQIAIETLERIIQRIREY